MQCRLHFQGKLTNMFEFVFYLSSRHPYLEKLIREFFKENVTEAHLKMTEVPQE